MFFFGLLIYLIVLSFLYWPFLHNLQAIKFLPTFVWVILLYIISTFLGVFLAFLIDVYNPQAKERIRNLARVVGVKWLCILTGITIFIFVFLEMFWFKKVPDSFFLSYLMPVLVVSCLNAIGFEIPLKRLDETPEPGKIILPEIPPAPKIKEEIIKDFRWKFNENNYNFPLFIRRSIYDSFKEQERILDCSKWAQEYVVGGISGEIREIAHQLYKVGMNYGSYQEVSFVLSFVQQVIQYQKEEIEYPKYPVETLVDETGDCEDFSILGAAILKCMGYEVALLILPNHAALGVAGAEGIPGSYVEFNDMHYYYCEMTVEGWKIGQMPEEYEKMKMDVFPIPPLPTKVVRLEDVSVSEQERDRKL